MDTKKVKISIQGEGFSFDEQITKAVAVQIMGICITPGQGHEQKNNNPFEAFNFNQTQKPKESVVEYVQRHNAKSNPEKILAFAGFIKNAQTKETFFQNEIKSLFRDAREILPANFTRDFNLVISNGWIHNDHETKDLFYITQTGLKALESGFAADPSLKKVVTRRKSVKKAQKN